ncbi:MAG: aminomethyl-transferring glycine dehydrogenase subunit GcvPB, partial [Devosia sp.]|nr:aminomethyl-transferring glycine dehydrogenase subunit GcvPB [Devosia sp.]
MSMNTQGRPTGIGVAPAGASTPAGAFASTSGSSLLPNEPLLFEIGDTEHSGVDLPDASIGDEFLGGFKRTTPLDLAGLTEPEALRHYVRLSRLNYSIDSGMYPLGSCTMKHNPRLNEKMARLAGFADL